MDRPPGTPEDIPRDDRESRRGGADEVDSKRLSLGSYVRCVLSPDGIVRDFRGSDDLLVLEPDQFIGRAAFDNPQPEVAAAFEPARWRVMKRNDDFVRYRHAATSWRGLAEIHDSLLRRDAGNLVLVCRDLTAHYVPSLRRALATTLATLRESFDEDGALCLTDDTGRVWWWPRGAERMTRIPFHWMLGRQLPIRLPAREQSADLMTPARQLTIGLYPVNLWQGLAGVLWLLRDATRVAMPGGLSALVPFVAAAGMLWSWIARA